MLKYHYMQIAHSHDTTCHSLTVPLKRTVLFDTVYVLMSSETESQLLRSDVTNWCISKMSVQWRKRKRHYKQRRVWST
jgi:hypothetical protein